MRKMIYYNELYETYGSDEMFRDATLDEWLRRYTMWGGPMMSSLRYGGSPKKRNYIFTGDLFYQFEKGELHVKGYNIKRGSYFPITKLSKKYLKHEVLDYKAKCVILIAYISNFIHRDSANDGEECVSCGFVGRCHEHHDPPVAEAAKQWLYTRSLAILVNILKKGTIGDAHRRFIEYYYGEGDGSKIILCGKCHPKCHKKRDPSIEQQWKVFLDHINEVVGNFKERKASLWDFF